MPKNKTHQGVAKRIKRTGRGKLLHQRAGKSHLLEKKPSRRTRRLDGVTEVSRPDRKRLNRMLGGR